MANPIAIKNQARKLLKRLHELSIRNKDVFANTLFSREIESLGNRHLGGLEEKKATPQQPVEKKKRRVIQHTAESFNTDNIKKKDTPQVVVAGDDYSAMTPDELKVYAKKQLGLNTKGVTNKEDLIELIQAHKDMKEIKEAQRLEKLKSGVRELTTPKVDGNKEEQITPDEDEDPIMKEIREEQERQAKEELEKVVNEDGKDIEDEVEKKDVPIVDEKDFVQPIT